MARRVAPLLTLAGAGAVGAALAEGARGPRPARRPAPPALALPGRPVRLQRAAHHDRRRRPAGQPALQGDRRVPGHVRVGGARAAHRLARAADHQRGRLPREPAAAAPRHRHPRRPRAGLRHAGRARRSCSTRPPTSASAGASRPATAGAASPAPSTSASTGSAAIPAPPCSCSLVGFLYQLVLVLAAVAAAQALGLGKAAGLTALLAFFPAVAIAQVLPIGISGLGRARGRLRAVPRPARRRHRGGHRARPAALPPQPRGEPARRPGLRGGRPRRRQPATPWLPHPDLRRRPASPVADDRRWPRRRRRPPHARASAGGRRSPTASPCTSCTRSCGTGSAPPAATRARPSGTPRRSSTSSAGSTSTSSPTCSSWYLDLPGRGLIRLWNVYYGIAHFLVTLRGADVAVPAGPGPLPALAQHARVHDLPRGRRLRRLLADAAPPARRSRRVRRLPDLRARTAAAPRRPATRRAATGTATSTRSTATAGGSPSATTATRTCPTSTRRCRACTSAGRPGRALVLVPLLRRRWAKVLAALYPVLTLLCIMVTGNHYWIDGLGGLLCLAVGYALARVVTGRFARPDRRSPALQRP